MASLSLLDWTNIATITSVFFAAVAAGFSALSIYFTNRASAEQRRFDEKRALEQAANDFLKTYLELAIAHPNLSTDNKRDQEQQQYEWFVSFTLFMAQKILKAHPDDKNWRAMLQEQVKYNEKELRVWRSKYAAALASFGPEVRSLVDAVLAEKKTA